MSSEVPSPDHDRIDAREIAELLDVSPPTAQKMMERGTIQSWVDAGGQRRATRADVLAWRELRERRSASLEELIQLAEANEVDVPTPRRRISDDPNVEDALPGALDTSAADMRVWEAVPSGASSTALLPDTDSPDVVAARLAAAVIRATEALGAREKAERWLHSTPPCFNGLTPAELLRTGSGALKVDRVLGRIEHGIVG